MLIAGIVCLVLAAVAAGIAWWQHRAHKQLLSVEGSTCGDLRQLADAVSVEAGAGLFRQRCELSGTVQPAHVGTVQAPQTKREGVWYRTKVTHEYWDYDYVERNGRQVRERTRQSETLTDDQSDAPFAVDDGTGQAIVYPEKAEIHEPEQVYDQFEEKTTRSAGLLELIGASFLGNDETIGYRREEWLLPVGTKVFVQGEVVDEDGKLHLRDVEKGEFRVSTKSEAELIASAASGRKWATVAAVAFAVIGVALAVAGAVAG
jgi:hypothetical protein